MDKGIAFTLGPFSVRWYGLIITTAVLAGYLLAYYRLRHTGKGSPDHLTNILIVGLVSAIVGARLYYVLFNLSSYRGNWPEMLAVWHGGLAIHGALTGGILAIWWYSRRYKLDFWFWADLLAPSVILGQAIGRWGNWMNQEAFGLPTRLPWAIYIPPEKRPFEFLNRAYFHPTFLYESLWNLAGLALLLWLSRRQSRTPEKWPSGTIFLAYAVYYSVGRFFIEGLRTDALMFGPIRAAQLASVAIVLVAGIWILAKRRAARDSVAVAPEILRPSGSE